MVIFVEKYLRMIYPNMNFKHELTLMVSRNANICVGDGVAREF